MAPRTLADLRPDPAWQDPVVIVGAGPVGMSAALGLAHYGIPSVVLDEGEGTAIEGSRAIFMERHAMEILGAWSPVGRQVAEQGMTLLAGRVFFRSTELYKTFTTPPDPDIRYPRFVNFPQNVLERLEYEALCELPCCAVRWRHKVFGLVQDDTGVTVQAETPNGTEYFRAPFVLACDGPRSTVRHLLGLSFPGESRGHHFLILDVRMELETPRERWFWFDPPFNPGRTALLHPQPESIYRLDYQLAPDEDLETVQSPEAINKRIVATVGKRPYEVVWKSVYTYQQRALERFTHGRVMFLGDAAHLMSPFGGRGLNSGIQDAWNLVWKLALVRAGAAPRALLETYNDERQQAARENLRLTADTMRFLVPKRGTARWRRDAILRLSLPFAAMRQRVNAGHMSNPFTYRDSPLISEDSEPRAGTRPSETSARFLRGPAAGSLAPELVLTGGAGESVSLLDCFGAGFVVFSFCADPDAGIAALDAVRGRLPADVPVSLYVIAPRMATAPAPRNITCLLDGDGKCAAAYGAGPSTLYVIRPDRHIASRRFVGDANDLPALLRRAAGLGSV
ncbi:MAG TPA: FAD-dependent monooxygenase [Ktedonobacterales bacterium]|nr:FAD-dependent monooxygenase [Ktedonobacterales bacterium]